MEILKSLGYKIRKKSVVWGYTGKKKVDFAISTKEGYIIGFERDIDDSFQIVADWYGVKDEAEAIFAARLKRKFHEAQKQIKKQYAYQATLQKLKEQGYEVVEQEESEDGSMRLVARRWK